MISYEKKAAPQPSPKDAPENRFEKIRKAAADGHRKTKKDADDKSETLFEKSED